ncbi:MAG: ComEA family DNA-binding protein [Balneolaceae bacterium]
MKQQTFGAPSCRLTSLLMVLGLILLCAPDALFGQAQSDTTRSQVERDIERAIDELDPEESDLDLEQLLEFLQDLANNPLNINRASIDDLTLIPGIDLRLAQAIITHRRQTSPFESVDDLLLVRGIGPVTLNRIRPYVSVGSGFERGRDLYLNPSYWTNNSRFEATTRFQRVLQDQEGFQRPDSLGGFVGNPVNYYQRFRYTTNHISATLTQDKDPGEPLSGPTDFDFTSWHIALRDNGRLKEFIIGDYSVGFGQGLTLWSGSTFGKGSEVIRTPVKNDRGIRPYTSSQETNAFRGVAFTWGNRLQLSGFYSDRLRTASVVDDEFVRFPTETALHRTLNERDRRLNLGQETYGGRIRYEFNRGFVGVTGFQNRFDRPIQAGSQPFQVFSFEGRSHRQFGADTRWVAGPALLFGEVSYTDNGGHGVVSGTTLNLGPGTDMTAVYRYYAKDFQSIFGAGFGEQSSNPQNEEGFYLGIRQRLGSQVQISAYMDHFRFPSARFRTRRPSSGHDWLALAEYTPFRELELTALVRFKQNQLEFASTDDFGREIRLLGENKRTNARFQAAYFVRPNVRLRTRFDMTRARTPNNDPSYGFLIFQDIRFLPTQNLTIDARITLFDTDDFDSRVFQFENDLLGVFSNTMLFNQGQRMYVVVNYRVSDRIQIWGKASTTLMENQNTIGSGLNEITGPRRSDIGLQARIRI